MTEFIFNAPKCLVDAEKVLKEMDKNGINYLDNEEAINAMKIILKKPLMVYEARWNWLAENKNELWLFEISTEDIDYMIADIVRIFDKKSNCVWEFIADYWPVKRRLKNKMKRHGIPTDLICYG